MTGHARFGANGGGFKTECVGEGVVLQVCEAKSLTMFGASENKLTPDIATAGANAMGGVAGYRGQGTDDQFTKWRAGANEERAVDFDSNMAAMGLAGVGVGGGRRSRSEQRQHWQQCGSSGSSSGGSRQPGVGKLGA
jgi:hypothetical protein